MSLSGANWWIEGGACVCKSCKGNHRGSRCDFSGRKSRVSPASFVTTIGDLASKDAQSIWDQSSVETTPYSEKIGSYEAAQATFYLDTLPSSDSILSTDTDKELEARSTVASFTTGILPVNGRNLSGTTLATQRADTEREEFGRVYPTGHRKLAPKRPQAHTALLERALNKANDAVSLDNVKNYKGCTAAYVASCDILTQVIDRTKDDKDKHRLMAIRSAYEARINELQTIEHHDPDSTKHSLNKNSQGHSMRQAPFDRSQDWAEDKIDVYELPSPLPFRSGSMSNNLSRPISMSSRSDREIVEYHPRRKATQASTHLRDSRGTVDSLESCDSLTSRLSLAEEPNARTLKFISELASRIVRLALKTSHSDFKSCQGTYDDSSSPSQQSQTAETPISGQSSTSKRQREEDEQEEEGERGDEGNHPPPKAKQQKREPKLGRLFACPYTKFDPQRYSERNSMENYRTCSTLKLISISRIKQHLERTHKRPEFYCGRCYEAFEDRNLLNDHHRSDPRCEKVSIARYEEMMSDSQWKSIKTQRLDNNSASWYKIFKILFKDTPEPTSPYASTCNEKELQNFTQFFCWVGPQQMLNLVRDRLDQGNGPLNINMTLSNLIMETFENALPRYEEGLEQVRQRFQSDDATVEVPKAQGSIPMNNDILTLTHSHEQRQIAELDAVRSSKISDNENVIFAPEQVNNEFGALWEELCVASHTEDDWILDPQFG